MKSRFALVCFALNTLFNLNVQSLKVVSRYRDPQLQVTKYYSDLENWVWLNISFIDLGHFFIPRSWLYKHDKCENSTNISRHLILKFENSILRSMWIKMELNGSECSTWLQLHACNIPTRMRQWTDVVSTPDYRLRPCTPPPRNKNIVSMSLISWNTHTYCHEL